jgi:hypothetical protein
MKYTIRDFYKCENKARFVLFFAFIYLFSLSLPLFANTPTSSISFLQNCKKEFSTKKTFSTINNNTDSILSIDDVEMDTICISTFKILICLINSVDNQSLFLKDCQSRMQFHVPLFLVYQDIRI